MTPKEKAEELFNKFHLEVLDREGTSAMNGFEAKQCALIAVDEILWEIIKYADNSHQYVTENSRYWQEVKQEIKKL